MNVAVILAGGVGSRLGASVPKQFFQVAGKTVIEHTVDVFERNGRIDEIAIVIHPLYVDFMEQLTLKNTWKKVTRILKGGEERYFSSLAAIRAYEGVPDACLIFHDAVRPLIGQQVIHAVTDALQRYNAVAVAVPATDTIFQVNPEGTLITDIPSRKLLRRGQTPQAFRLHTISKAYGLALRDPHFVCTDDCGTVIQYLPDEPIYVVPGEESNLKLTYKEDAFLLDTLFQLRSHAVPETMDYSRLKDKVMVVFGGSSGSGQQLVRMAAAHGARVFPFSSAGTDISRWDAVDKAFAEVSAQTGGRVDCVVNMAAMQANAPLASMDRERINTIIATNYNGMVHVASAAYPYLQRSRGQLLLCIYSSNIQWKAFCSLCSSTKAATVGFMQALAQEWEADGIRVNAITPERIDNPMWIRNFGIEPENTLLSDETLAGASLQTLLSEATGRVVNVK